MDSKKEGLILEFHSKANTLKYLKDKVKYSVILPMLIISRNDITNRQRLKELIIENNMFDNVIVRSSAWGEDIPGSTHAGEYLSVIDISGVNAVVDAIYKVFNSYDKNGRKKEDNDTVFIQPFLKDCSISGVVFIGQPSTGADCYVIDYSINSESDRVTSGKSNDMVEYVLYKGKTCSDSKLSNIIKASVELEQLTGCNHLDIEFVVKDNRVYILQVRRLIINDIYSKNKHISLNVIRERLISIANSRSIARRKMLFGVMPDWNPAELIGVRPKPLTLSLYMKLVTDRAWDIERTYLGYKDISHEPVVKDIFGIPYVDVITSFYSLVPSTISTTTTKKLVDFYIELLNTHKEWHDKIEYEIVIDCLYDSPKVLEDKLSKGGFSQEECNEIIKAVTDLTVNILNNKEYISSRVSIAENIEKLSVQCLQSDMTLKDKIIMLIEIIIKNGTIPFSGLARCAFIGTKLLRYFAIREVITQTEYNDFMKGINTVSRSIHNDFYNLKHDDFMKRYGFMRPGMYDILSLRYDDNNAIYFEKVENNIGNNIIDFNFIPTNDMLNRINYELKRIGLNVEAESFLKFTSDAVKAREYVKFLFSHSISDLLESIKDFAKNIGITPEDISYCKIEQIFDDNISSIINKSRQVYNETLSIYLPQIITNENDIYEFYVESSQPSFISTQDISCEIVQPKDNIDISDKIVLLEAADPGMDWIFTKNIKGLITAYGGTNSHMAIRVFEHGIAAAIGVGMTLFRRLLHAKYVRLNCECKKIEVLNIETNIM